MEAASIAHAVTSARAAIPDWWSRVDDLVERAPRPSDVLSHRLHLVAAARRRAEGREVPEEFRREEIAAALTALAAPVVLTRIRSILGGPILLIKGPELAALYPDPAIRPFGDLDVLVADSPAAWRALRDAGFVPCGDPRLYVDIHHLRPLYLPGYPLIVELHHHPKWIEWGTPPTFRELASAAVPSATGVGGLLAPSPAHHAVLVAAHSWAHEPLRRLRELVDLRLLLDATGREEVDAAARELHVARVVRASVAAADAVLGGGRRSFAVRAWARNIAEARERTVLESHLEHWLAPFSARAPLPALAAAGAALGRDLRPEGAEGWRAKLARMWQAIRHASARRSDHDRALVERVEKGEL